MQDDSGDFGDFSSAFPGNEILEWGFCDYSTTGLPPATEDATIPDVPPLPEGLDFDLTSAESEFLPFTTITDQAVSINQSTPFQLTTGGARYDEFEYQNQEISESSIDQAHQDDDWDEFGGFEGAVMESSSVNGATSNDSGHNKSVPDSNTDTTLASSPATVFLMCFASSTKSDIHMGFTGSGETGAISNFSWLSRLKMSIDFTVPLYKWDTSYLQSCYYTSIKVDPILISKTDMTSAAELMPVVEGQSAALDLIESFGFEGGIEPSFPTSKTDNFLSATATTLQQSHSGPTLLDLSLPNSPSEEMQSDSFTLDADLQGLDLHSTETERQTTSIEQLLLNEKLVINRTTWMDSELEQLGAAATLPALQPSSPHTEQCKEYVKKASFQEQLERLGLDTSKTTLATQTKPSVVEMSLSARLVFDRLPNLAFMLQDTLVPVEHQFY